MTDHTYAIEASNLTKRFGNETAVEGLDLAIGSGNHTLRTTLIEESIGEETDQLEEIAQLEDGEVSLERANELHEEGRELIEELQGERDIGDGEVRERTGRGSTAVSALRRDRPHRSKLTCSLVRLNPVTPGVETSRCHQCRRVTD